MILHARSNPRSEQFAIASIATCSQNAILTSLRMKSLYENLPPVEIGGRRLVGRVLFGLLVLVSALVGATAGLLLVYTTDLPQVDALEAYRPSSITELYDDHGRVIGSFALQRRVVAGYDDFPPVLRDALVSIEDKDFYRHSGINFWRIVGAAYRDIESGGKVQGASTLTMQLARNLFLSPDRLFHRKVQEAMLAIQIERRFTKPQIFTLYANQIFLGHGVYGFEAASEYLLQQAGEEADAGRSRAARRIAQGPDRIFADQPSRPRAEAPQSRDQRHARRRQDHRRPGRRRARSAPLVLHLAHDPNSLAPYFVEEIRRYLESKYGSDQVHEGGLKVYTSLDVDLQKAANQAVLDGLAAYERRHGWKGHLRKCRRRRCGPRQIFTSRLGRRARGQRLRPCAGDLCGHRNRHAEVRPLHRRSRPARRCLDAAEAGRHSQGRRHLLRQDSVARRQRRAHVSASNRTPARKARCSPSTTRPAESRPWSAAATSTNRNSIAPRRPCARLDRRSSRTSTPPSSIRAPAPTTPILDEPISFETSVRPVHSAQLRREV